MDTEEELLLYAAVVLYIKQAKQRRKLSKIWEKKRAIQVAARLTETINLEQSEWRTSLGMDDETYLKLLKLVTPLIRKRDTNMREAIAPHGRLSACLSYLASGKSYEELKRITMISPQCLGNIVPVVCQAIITVLKDYMKMPETEEEWRDIARGFEGSFGMPNCLGSVGGRHVWIVPPRATASDFWNHRLYYSVILMGAVDVNQEFIWCEVGVNGRICDGSAIKETQFYDKLVKNKLNIPKKEKCNNSSTELPYVFVGDEAFAPIKGFLSPFSRNNLTPERDVYNDRLSQTQQVSDKVFDVISKRFKILHTALKVRLDRIDLVVLTCCFLHNFLRRHSAWYLLDTEELAPTNFVPLDTDTIGNSNTDSRIVTDQFLRHFNEEGNEDVQDATMA